MPAAPDARPTIDPPDRPRERLRASGAEALSTIELVAVVLGTGTVGISADRIAEEMLATAGGLIALARATPGELTGIAGVGEARAARIAAAFELGRRALAESGPLGRLMSPADVACILRPRFHGLLQEIFVVLALDARLRVVEEIEIARGALDAVAVHPREVFRPLIRRGAAAAVLAHNHPSGDPTPSRADVELTRRLREVGDLVGIPIVDHVVIGDGYASILELDGPDDAFRARSDDEPGCKSISCRPDLPR
jgi:DNA repair protein RadC